MGGKEVPIQNIWGNVTEISVTVDVCSATVKYYSSVLCGDPALRFCSGNLISKVDSVLVAMSVKNEYID